MFLRLVRGLRETEVIGTRELLMCAVDSPRGEQFLGADNAERFAQLIANEILPTVATAQRHIGCFDISTASEPCYQVGVFVVGVRGDPEHPHGLGTNIFDEIGCRRIDIEQRLRATRTRYRNSRSDSSDKNRSVHFALTPMLRS